MATTTRADLRLPVQRRPRFASRPLATAAVVAATVIAELGLAVAIADPRFSRLLMVPLAVGAAALLFRLPLAATGLLLVLAATVFHAEFFPLAGPARFAELVLVGLLFVAAVRPRRRTWGGVAGAALFAFFGLLALANLGAVGAGRVDLIGALNWSRPLLLVSLFWVVIRMFPDRRSLLGLVQVAAGAAVITGLISVAAALGGPIGEYLQNPGGVFVNDDSTLGIIKRVRFPGLALAYGLFWVVVMFVLHSRGGRRGLWLGVLGLMSICLIFSLNRNMWLGIIGGLALMLALASVSVRAGLLTRVGTGLVLLVLFLGSAGAGLGAGSDSAVRPLLERMGTLFNDPATIGSNEKSLQGRASETRLALNTIGENLVTGVGAGVSYGYYFNELQPSGRWIPKPQKFLHNQWLWLTLVGGVPLLLAWVTFLGATLRRAWAPGREALTTAAGVGLTMIMVSALVELYFSTEGMTTTIGLLAGVIHAGRKAVDETGEPLL